jgi:hypothetical protein
VVAADLQRLADFDPSLETLSAAYRLPAFDAGPDGAVLGELVSDFPPLGLVQH